MSIKIRKITALFMSLVCAAAVTACGSSDNTSSDVEIVYEYITQSGSSVASGDSSGTDNSGSSAGGGSTSSGTQQGGNAGNSGGNSGSSGGVDPSKYRGTTVRYATWKDPQLNEDGDAVNSFEEKYGIKVQIDMVEQDDYINLVTAMIAADDSPDIVFCTGTFPSILSLCQPIDVAQIDKSDPFWDQSMFELSKVNGKSYLLNAVGNIWNEVDCLLYNKALLKKANCYTPEEYAAQGKWTWDALEQIMTAVDKLGTKYVGGAFEVVSLLASAGCTVYSYKDGKFYNGMNSMMTDATRRIATWFNDGIANKNTYDFRVGNAGITIVNAFGLKKTGFFFDSNWSDFGCYYIPDYDENHKAVPCGIFRGWGIAKGAKNPVAAGIFLKHYLDVDNYDISDAFINKEAERFFFELTTGNSDDKLFYFNDAQDEVITDLDTSIFFHEIPNQAPGQVAASLSAQKNAVDNAVKKLNDYLSRIK